MGNSVNTHQSTEINYRIQFAWVSGLFQLLLLILFIVCLEYGDGATESSTGDGKGTLVGS